MQELFANRYRPLVPATGAAADPGGAHASDLDVVWRAPRATHSYRTQADVVPRELAIVLRRSASDVLGELPTLALTCPFLVLWALAVARSGAWASLALPVGLLGSIAASAFRRIVWGLTRTTIVVGQSSVRASDGPLPLGRSRVLRASRIVAFWCWRNGDGSTDLVARLQGGSETRLVRHVPSFVQAQAMKRALEEALRAGA